MKQLSAGLELRLVKEQSSLQRTTLELRQDLERGVQQAVDLCSEVLRGEQQQLVREFRQELERRMAGAASAPIVEGVEELHEEVQELREALEGLKALVSWPLRAVWVPGAGGRAEDGGGALAAHRGGRCPLGFHGCWQETVAEKVRRCDSAAEVCERLARRMEWQMAGGVGASGLCGQAAESPEGPGSGIPGEKNAYATPLGLTT